MLKPVLQKKKQNKRYKLKKTLIFTYEKHYFYLNFKLNANFYHRTTM